MSDALVALLVGLELEGPATIVVDMVEQGALLVGLELEGPATIVVDMVEQGLDRPHSGGPDRPPAGA